MARTKTTANKPPRVPIAQRKQNTQTPSASSPSSPPSPQSMGRTKNPNRGKDSSTAPTNPSRGTTHQNETESSPPSPVQRQTRQRGASTARGSSNDSSFSPLHEFFGTNTYKPFRFSSTANWKFFTNNISKRPVTKSFLVDLSSFKSKGLNFEPFFCYQEWLPLFEINEPVYPDLVR